MYTDRKALYAQLEEKRDTKLLVYITGDKPEFQTQISDDALDFFIEHLDEIGTTRKISLFIYTLGGKTMSAWNIVNLIKMFCDEFEIIVPSKCRSAGTLMCLGAQSIVMTKQATLGPIDPSLNSPLNPANPFKDNETFPVSVEAIKGYLELVSEEVGIKNDENLTQIVLKLTDHIHPLVLGDVYRVRSQIQMLARRLLSGQINHEDKITKIVSFLCSDSGSHDYTINRREAKNDLGLPIEKPDEELYNLIKQIYSDIHKELQLGTKFDVASLIAANNPAQYTLKRALIESVVGGADSFVSEGILKKKQDQVVNQKVFQGWRHEQ